MSPQLLWTIAGLLLTILTLGGVTVSSFQSMETSTAKLVASEVDNVAIASKLWLANKSTTGNFNGVNAEGVATFIPDLALDTSTPKKLISKAEPASTRFAIAATGADKQVVITVNTGSAAVQDLVMSALSGKACTAAKVATTTDVSYTCNG